MTERRLLLLRHGRTASNVRQVFQGRLDTELDEVGRAQSEAVAPALAALGPAALACSTAQRARQTVEPLAGLTGHPVDYDERLAEIDAGVWSGLPVADVVQRWPDEYAAYRGGADIPAGGAERPTEVAARALAAVEDLLERAGPGGLAVAVTHGVVSRVVTCSLIGLQYEHWQSFSVLPNCGWSLLAHRSGRWRLLRYGQTADAAAVH